MISLFWLGAGAVGAWTAKVIVDGVRAKEENEDGSENGDKGKFRKDPFGTDPKSDNEHCCFKCIYFNKEHWKESSSSGNPEFICTESYMGYSVTSSYKRTSEGELTSKRFCNVISGGMYNGKYFYGR